MTDRRLIDPQGRVVNLLEIKVLRRLWGDVQIVTTDGAKHLMKHLADPQAVIDTIEAARAARCQPGRRDDRPPRSRATAGRASSTRTRRSCGRAAPRVAPGWTRPACPNC